LRPKRATNVGYYAWDEKNAQIGLMPCLPRLLSDHQHCGKGRSVPDRMQLAQISTRDTNPLEAVAFMALKSEDGGRASARSPAAVQIT